MGMGVFQQKELKFARRPQNRRSHFPPQNYGRKFYGHHVFSDLRPDVLGFSAHPRGCRKTHLLVQAAIFGADVHYHKGSREILSRESLP